MLTAIFYELTQHIETEITIIAASSVAGGTLIVTGIMRSHIWNGERMPVWRQRHSWSCMRSNWNTVLPPQQLEKND
jgi:hypothetical protein